MGERETYEDMEDIAEAMTNMQMRMNAIAREAQGLSTKMKHLKIYYEKLNIHLQGFRQRNGDALGDQSAPSDKDGKA